MKYDFIYSDAVNKITQKKKDGTKFFSGDTFCVIVSDTDKIYSSFNASELNEGKLVSVNSGKLAFQKLTDSKEKVAAAMIMMNCETMNIVIPEQECLDILVSSDKKNKETLIVSPEARYIKLSDISSYVPGGDNSSIESEEKIDTEKVEKAKAVTEDFSFDFEAIPDDSEKHETVYLFARPGQKADTVVQQGDANHNQTQNYVFEDVPSNYQQINDPVQKFMQNGMNVQNIPNGINGQYMPNGMNGQYISNRMNGQYMPNEMNGQYMPNGMNGQYMTNGMNDQNMPNGMNGQNMPNGMNGQNMPNGMNDQNMPNGMNGQNMPNGMNGQYMANGMNGQYMANGMNGQYMANGMNGQYMPNGINAMYDPYTNQMNIPQQASVYINQYPAEKNNNGNK